MEAELISWALEALGVVRDDQKDILENQRIILERLDEIKGKLETLQRQFDEIILVEFRTGMEHLLAGFNSDIAEVRNEEFQMARGIFSKLINLNPREVTHGTSGKIENPFLICMGYWGSYMYFSARSDYRNALIHAYECVAKYPTIACRELNLFPRKIFSKDYASTWRTAILKLEAVVNLYNSKNSSNKKEKFLYYTLQTLRAGAAGVVGAAGAGAAYVIGVLTIGIGAGPVGYAGYQAAKKVWDSLEVPAPHIEKIEDMEKEITRLTKKVESLPKDLVRECETRRDMLKRVSMKDPERLQLQAP